MKKQKIELFIASGKFSVAFLLERLKPYNINLENVVLEFKDKKHGYTDEGIGIDGIWATFDVLIGEQL
jgi:hypothetical protein